MDVSQLAEQNALRKQLYQEQELLQRFQERQEEKLRVQHDREKAALDVKVEDSKKELDKLVRGQQTWKHCMLYPIQYKSNAALGATPQGHLPRSCLWSVYSASTG